GQERRRPFWGEVLLLFGPRNRGQSCAFMIDMQPNKATADKRRIVLFIFMCFKESYKSRIPGSHFNTSKRKNRDLRRIL
ncbi:MAG TPA: hypothetical protein DCZ51_14845, partial [Bacteroidales bacterium]|nr:hypothetical protein [Bacteroidales bacterium]